jgi:hypothetical protein
MSWRIPDPRDAAVRSLRELTDGQRWTAGIALVVTALFLGFGMRQPPAVLGPFAAAGTAPPPVVVPSSPGTSAPPVATSPSPPSGSAPAASSGAAPRPATPPGDLRDPQTSSPGPVGSAAPEVIALVRSGDGVTSGRDDASIAAVFLTDLPGATVVDVEDAVGTVCAATEGVVVVAGEGLPDRLRQCAIGAGAVVVSHDDRGSSGTLLSTALGAQGALVEAGRVANRQAAIALVVQEGFAEEAEAAQRILQQESREVVVVVVSDDGVPAAEMLGLVRDGVDTVVLGTPVSAQDRWLATARTLRMPFTHVVADVGDAIENERYTAAGRGLRAVTATRLAWSSRTHGETEAQQRCRTRFEDAVGSEVSSVGELVRVHQWCQHVALASRIIAAGGRVESFLDGDRFDSPVTSPLIASTETGFGPNEVAVLDWDLGCACWAESAPYTTRRGPS